MEQQKGLIARYLQAVRFWLPRGQQDDIVAELAEDLQSRMEEQEAVLGRSLDEGEIAAVLKRMGSPVLVANRYLPQPQRSLIGPLLYPVYVFMLKMVALFYLLPWLLVAVGLAAFHYHGNTVAESLGAFLKVVFTSFAAMTLVFALLERFQAETRLFENWDPRKLPPLRVVASRQIKRSSSVVEIIVNLVLALWWAGGWGSDVLFLAANLQITVAPVWNRIITLLVCSCIANIALAVYNLFYPSWTRRRMYLRLLLDIAGAGIFCWFLRAGVLLRIASPELSSDKAASVVHAINTAVDTFFPYAVAATLLVIAIADLPRIVRDRFSDHGRTLAEPNLRAN